VAKIKKITVDYNIKDLDLFAKDYKTTIEVLKELNPWLMKNTLTIKEEGKSYTLLIPTGTFNEQKTVKDTILDNITENPLTSNLTPTIIDNQ
jgi:hypothetical protein